jgi:terminase large subunit-like protein
MGGIAGDGTRDYELTYDPLPSQRKFYRSEARFKGFSGPIGSGKSQALCQEAIRLCFRNPGRMGLIGAPTYPMLRDATQTMLFELLDEHGLEYEHNKAESTVFVRACKARIILRAVEEFERLRGTNLAWFGLDELTYTREGAWLRLEGRLRDPKAKHLCGFAVWTPKGFDWVYERFVASPKAGYHVTLARPHENRFLLEKIPDFYERLKGSYDERFYQQEVLGQYLNLNGGLVYASFDRVVNVRRLERSARLTLLWALDFNVDPMCSVVVQIDRQEIRVLDEIVLKRASTEDACEAFMERFGDHAGSVIVYGDASGSHLQTTGRSDYQIVREAFRKRAMKVDYRVPAANPAVRERVNLVNGRLRSADGRAHLLVDPRCKELIKDFEQVAYKEDSPQVDKERDRRRTHLSDALGYLIWQECRPLTAIGERPDRLL